MFKLPCTFIFKVSFSNKIDKHSYLKKNSLYSIFLALLSADYPTIKSRLQGLMSVSKYLWVSVKGACISEAMVQDLGFMSVKF